MADIEKAKEIMINYYSPEPSFFEVWYEEKEEMYRSIAKYSGDHEIFLSTWDEDYDCQGEIIIDQTVFEKIKNIMEAI